MQNRRIVHDPEAAMSNQTTSIIVGVLVTVVAAVALWFVTERALYLPVAPIFGLSFGFATLLFLRDVNDEGDADR